ncbi:MAG: cytochrome c oxidase subunit II [Acidobacteriota bacterium]|nr:cytochrome c oxidase subunit II [Acidobacteriota bacterium]
MFSKFQLLPVQASSVGAEVDHLFLFLLLVTSFFALLIAGLVIFFGIRYRRSAKNPVATSHRPYDIPLEIAWTLIPTGLALVMFVWGAKVYVDMARPPNNALLVYVTAKQWMWKAQHLGGQREINELHIPVGVPVRLTMTSQDVIHSFFVPAFRTKQDVIPGRYTTEWFTATKAGKYHLFCAEFCGAKHSGMIGYIYAMPRREYEAWLTSGASEGSLASYGEKLFHQYGCANCHHFNGHGRGPNLQGVYGSAVEIQGGGVVRADDAYIRESIVQPAAKIVYGHADIMPSFAGLLNEEQLIQLIEYIKSIGPQAEMQEPSTSGSLPKPIGAGAGIGAPGSSSNATSPVKNR